MKKENYKPNFVIKYKNDKTAQEKLMNLILNMLIESNILIKDGENDKIV